ncbi:hypothetical protein GALL_291610 [mine drainage metagenome]|uniref:Uncharacterized protein n=1 Tax=mine drainage metagenome TaxID=410659 RepID=A0A1J5RLF6_9ZZZZ
MDAKRLFRIERVHIGGGRIRHQFHVGLVDRLPASDRRAVEHEAFVKEVFVDQIGDDGDVLQLAAWVGEADVDVFDVLILKGFKNLCLAHVTMILLLSMFEYGVSPDGYQTASSPDSPVRMRIACSQG